MVRIILIVVGIGLSSYSIAQLNAEQEESIWSNIFLPSIEVGYQFPNSSLIESSLRIGTSIEYRIRNNNDFFIRLNYDTYNSRYRLVSNQEITNTISGTVQFTDLMIAPGYRFGDNTLRLMVSAMPGVRFYEFPEAFVDQNQIIIEQRSKSIFCTMILSTLEYYLDEKSAITFSVFHNQVWKSNDFWKDGRSATGFSVGFITSLL